ncbi:alpha/beta hydrolase [Streptomyces sp. NPDC050856]|uniref:alpha/beta hydrolase n=1 Tax=Streptomyces sp. NPDC050856 TaxID=3154939 RepID=UPI0033ECDE02
MPTWQQLRDLKLDEYTAAADGWGKLSSQANAAKDRVDNEMLAKIRDTQKGTTADKATADLEQLSRNYQYLHTECGLIRTALNGLAAELAGPQKKLKQALEDAENLKFTVHADGSVEYPQSPTAPMKLPDGRGSATPGAPVPMVPGQAEANGDPNKGKAEEIAEKIDGALREAAEIDGRYSRVLDKLKAAPGLTVDDSTFIDAAADTKALQEAAGGYADDARIPKDKSPAENAQWWNGLTQEQRDEYATLYPASVGALDGLPSSVRDDANRMVLAEAKAQYQQDLKGIPPEPQRYLPNPTGSYPAVVTNEAWRQWEKKYGDRRAHLESSLSGMRAIENRFNQTGRNGLPEAYLLAFSPEGHGRAVVANGNPDTADHTAVYVPGTTSNLGKVGGDIDRMANLWRETARMPGAGNVSTITWLGYDAPQSIVKDAPFSHYANDGAPAYNRFMNGLETAQGGPDKSHTTAIGHSYGTTLIGSAARQGDLPADDVILAGSPGVQVGSAEEMDVPKGHVWNEEADDDPVPDIGRYGHGGSQWRLGGGVWLVPSDEPFGANQMSTDTTGHSDYWKANTQSLRNQAAVVAGQYSEVKHVE